MELRQFRITSGFTLLELMVVLVIIGIIMTMAVLSIGDGGVARKVTQDGRRIVALLELAQDEALMQSRKYGLYLTETSYQFLVENLQTDQQQAEQESFLYNEDKQEKPKLWLDAEQDNFRQRTLQHGASFSIAEGDFSIPLEKEEEVVPQIIIGRDGEFIEPFTIAISLQQQQLLQLGVDEYARLQLTVVKAER